MRIRQKIAVLARANIFEPVAQIQTVVKIALTSVLTDTFTEQVGALVADGAPLLLSIEH